MNKIATLQKIDEGCNKNLPKIKQKSDLPDWFREGVTKIDYYGLSDVVISLRKSGMAYLDIERELRDKHSDELQGDNIAAVTIQKYCRKRIPNDDMIDKAEETVNVYNQNVDMMGLVDDNIELLKVYIDTVANKIKSGMSEKEMLTMFKVVNNLQNSLDKYILRKQDIVNHIFALQKEVYNMQTMNEVLEEVLTVIKEESPDSYYSVLSKLRDNPKFREAIKKMQPAYISKDEVVKIKTP